LKDRQKEYIDKNMSLCDINCKYKKYESKYKKVECECRAKLKKPQIEEFVINKDILDKNFKDIKNNINLVVMKCYHILFTKEGIIKNIGSYILLCILFINIFCFMIFIIKGYKILLHRNEYINKFIEIKEQNIKSKLNDVEINNKVIRNRLDNIKPEILY
jgi:hypothetical protein